MRRLWTTLLVAAAMGCAEATPEQQVVDDAAAALGGRDRVLAARTLSAEDGSGRQFNLGQDMRPDARGQTFTVSAMSRRVDLVNARARTELTRTPNFAYFQGPQPQKQVQGIDGSLGYNVAGDGTASRIADPAARDRRVDYFHHPVTAVRAALAEGSRLSNPGRSDSERRVDVALADGVAFTLVTDPAGLPIRIESASAHPNLGDVRLSTLFADYQEVSGLKLPATITTKVDDFVTGELRYGRQAVDETLELAAPPAAASAAAISGPPAPNVVVQDLAPGVWLLAGQSHHSALIELSDQLLLVEAPQSEARTLAVLAKVRELRPDKPLRKIITTHHHFDHTAGIRAAAASGLTIVTHSGNRAFFEAMTSRRHSIVADALSKNPKTVTVETVDDELAIKDAMRTVMLYHIAGNPHSDTMLMVYLPKERVIVEVDAYSPGAAANPYAANLLENITKRKLAVDRIVPLHGTVAPFADLAKTQTGG